MNTIRLAVAALLISPMAMAPATAEPFFCDDFETADLSHSENGFRWRGPNRTSIVRDDQYRVWYSHKSVEDGPYECRKWENSPASDGHHALRFKYATGKAMSEQRFDLGGAYPDFWMSFWIRVPVNYVHGRFDRGKGRIPGNQKFSAVWTESYKSDQPVIVFNFWDSRKDWIEAENSGNSFSTVVVVNATNVKKKHMEKYRNFIRYPEDQGRWMHVVGRFKIASYRGAEDGIVQWWRRWSDEQEYTVLSDRRNIGIGVDKGPKGFSGGYLMGWANGAYEEETEFLLDDFIVSTTSLLDVDISACPR